MLEFACLIPGILGLWLLIRGLRGRPVDQLPRCSACRYDLSGSGQGAGQCPECGADLTSEGAVVRGARVTRRPELAVGIVLLTVTISVGVTALWLAARGVSVNSYAPIWLLRWEAGSGESRAQAAAIGELERRIVTMRPILVQAIAAQALDRRHGVSTRRRCAWGSFLDSASAAGKLRSDQASAYIEDAVSVYWWGNTEAFVDATGLPMAPSIMFVFRPAVGWRSPVGYTADIIAASVDGVPVKIGDSSRHVTYAHVPNTSAGDTTQELGLVTPIEGKTLSLTWRVAFTNASVGAGPVEDWVCEYSIRLHGNSEHYFWGEVTRDQIAPAAKR